MCAITWKKGAPAMGTGTAPQCSISIPHFALLSPLRVVNAAAAAKRRLSIEIAALKAPFTAPPDPLTLNGRSSQAKDSPYSFLVAIPIDVVRSEHSSQIAMLESSLQLIRSDSLADNITFSARTSPDWIRNIRHLLAPTDRQNAAAFLPFFVARRVRV